MIRFVFMRCLFLRPPPPVTGRYLASAFGPFKRFDIHRGVGFRISRRMGLTWIVSSPRLRVRSSLVPAGRFQ